MEEDNTLPMDSGPVRPELVDEPKITDAQPQEAEQAADGQPRDEHGKFAPKETGVKEEGPPPSESVPVKALQDERRKRQELEQQIALLQQQAQQPQPQQPPEFWSNPDGALDARLEQFGSKLIQQFQQQQRIERINASEAEARVKYADYGDAFSAFQQAAQMNPTLIQRMQMAENPAEFAYQTGKRSMELEKVGSLDELLKAERAKWEAEVKAAAPRPSFPVSTVQDGSAAARVPTYTPQEPVLPMDRR